MVDAIDFVNLLSLDISFKVARDLEDPMRLQFEPQLKNLTQNNIKAISLITQVRHVTSFTASELKVSVSAYSNANIGTLVQEILRTSDKTLSVISEKTNVITSREFSDTRRVLLVYNERDYSTVYMY